MNALIASINKNNEWHDDVEAVNHQTSSYLASPKEDQLKGARNVCERTDDLQG